MIPDNLTKGAPKPKIVGKRKKTLKARKIFINDNLDEEKDPLNFPPHWFVNKEKIADDFLPPREKRAFERKYRDYLAKMALLKRPLADGRWPSKKLEDPELFYYHTIPPENIFIKNAQKLKIRELQNQKIQLERQLRKDHLTELKKEIVTREENDLGIAVQSSVWSDCSPSPIQNNLHQKSISSTVAKDGLIDFPHSIHPGYKKRYTWETTSYERKLGKPGTASLNELHRRRRMRVGNSFGNESSVELYPHRSRSHQSSPKNLTLSRLSSPSGERSFISLDSPQRGKKSQPPLRKVMRQPSSEQLLHRRASRSEIIQDLPRRASLIDISEQKGFCQSSSSTSPCKRIENNYIPQNNLQMDIELYHPFNEKESIPITQSRITDGSEFDDGVHRSLFAESSEFKDDPFKMSTRKGSRPVTQSTNTGSDWDDEKGSRPITRSTYTESTRPPTTEASYDRSMHTFTNEICSPINQSLLAPCEEGTETTTSTIDKSRHSDLFPLSTYTHSRIKILTLKPVLQGTRPNLKEIVLKELGLDKQTQRIIRKQAEWLSDQSIFRWSMYHKAVLPFRGRDCVTNEKSILRMRKKKRVKKVIQQKVRERKIAVQKEKDRAEGKNRKGNHWRIAKRRFEHRVWGDPASPRTKKAKARLKKDAVGRPVKSMEDRYNSDQLRFCVEDIFDQVWKQGICVAKKPEIIFDSDVPTEELLWSSEDDEDWFITDTEHQTDVEAYSDLDPESNNKLENNQQNQLGDDSSSKLKDSFTTENDISRSYSSDNISKEYLTRSSSKESYLSEESMHDNFLFELPPPFISTSDSTSRDMTVTVKSTSFPSPLRKIMNAKKLSNAFSNLGCTSNSPQKLSETASPKSVFFRQSIESVRSICTQEESTRRTVTPSFSQWNVQENYTPWKGKIPISITTYHDGSSSESDIEETNTTSSYDNHYNAHKIAEFRKLFDECDKDNSNTLDSCELGKIIFKSFGRAPSLLGIRSVLTTVDKNSDGDLDFDEFVAFISKYEEWETIIFRDSPYACENAFFDNYEVELLKDAFELFDSDKSESLDMIEVRKMLIVLGREPKNKDEQMVLKVVLNEVNPLETNMNFLQFLQLMRRFTDEQELQVHEKRAEIAKKYGFALEETEAFQEIFDQLDRSESGELTFTDIRTALKWCGIFPDSKQAEELLKIIKSLDDDGNSTVNFSEFLGLMKKLLKKNFMDLKGKTEIIALRYHEHLQRERLHKEKMLAQSKKENFVAKLSPHKGASAKSISTEQKKKLQKQNLGAQAHVQYVDENMDELSDRISSSESYESISNIFLDQLGTSDSLTTSGKKTAISIPRKSIPDVREVLIQQREKVMTRECLSDALKSDNITSRRDVKKEINFKLVVNPKTGDMIVNIRLCVEKWTEAEMKEREIQKELERERVIQERLEEEEQIRKELCSKVQRRSARVVPGFQLDADGNFKSDLQIKQEKEEEWKKKRLPTMEKNMTNVVE